MAPSKEASLVLFAPPLVSTLLPRLSEGRGQAPSPLSPPGPGCPWSGVGVAPRPAEAPLHSWRCLAGVVASRTRFSTELISFACRSPSNQGCMLSGQRQPQGSGWACERGCHLPVPPNNPPPLFDQIREPAWAVGDPRVCILGVRGQMSFQGSGKAVESSQDAVLSSTSPPP